jgi:glucan biosynthesis protein C
MERKHYLDQLRAFLMFLGIPYHASLIYSSNIDWTVSADETSAILTWVFQFTHTFRMPVFMTISGFFALMMIRKQGESVWLKSRFLRLGVPLVSVALMVNPFQMLAKAIDLHGYSGAWEEWLTKLSMPGGHWIQQLWFLMDLLIYCSLLAIAVRYGGKLHLGTLWRRILERTGRSAISIVFALVLAGIGAAGAAAVASVLDINYLLSNTFQTVRTLIFSLFFLLGVSLAYRPDWLEKFTTIHWPCWCAAAAACSILTAVDPVETPVCKILTYFLTPIAGVLSAHVMLSAARTWFNRTTAMTSKMVEASMTVYLFHSLFICWGAVLFLEISWNPLLEFSVIVVAATIASLVVHAIVRRNGTLLFLLNGITARRRNRPSLGAAAAVRSGV